MLGRSGAEIHFVGCITDLGSLAYEVSRKVEPLEVLC